MRKMLFGEPSFHPGLNLTVKKGPKWSDLVPGEVFELASEDPADSLLTVKNGQGTVVFVWTGTFDEIHDHWLTFEHAPTARNREDLKVGMDSIYEDWEDECTLIFFWY